MLESSRIISSNLTHLIREQDSKQSTLTGIVGPWQMLWQTSSACQTQPEAEVGTSNQNI